MSNDEKRIRGIHMPDDSMFLHHNIIVIGWKDFGDCSGLEPTQEAFKNHYSETYAGTLAAFPENS